MGLYQLWLRLGFTIVQNPYVILGTGKVKSNNSLEYSFIENKNELNDQL